MDTRVSQLSSELKVCEFERERTRLVFEETSKNLKDFQTENEKLLKKLEVGELAKIRMGCYSRHELRRRWGVYASNSAVCTA